MMKKKLAISLAALSLAMTGLSGCSSSEQFVGNWKEPVEGEKSITLYEDGTGKIDDKYSDYTIISTPIEWEALSKDEVRVDDETCTLKDAETLVCDGVEYVK